VAQKGWVQTAPDTKSHSISLKDADITGLDFGNNAGSYSISGTAFQDRNGDGKKDADDSGMSGWKIQLLQNNNLINVTDTGSDGTYAFRDLASGTYSVSEVVQEGWSLTAPASGSHSVTLKDADVSGMDFGNKGNLSISGLKYYDVNNNGVQDKDEPGLPGREVTLSKNGQVIATTKTAQDGSYSFNNLVQDTYELDDPIPVTLIGKSKIVVNIPAYGMYSISGVKFNDINGNKVRDPGESGIPNWVIDLVIPGPSGDVVVPTQTNANGEYAFNGLFSGTYKVREMAMEGWTPTTATEISVTISTVQHSR